MHGLARNLKIPGLGVAIALIWKDRRDSLVGIANRSFRGRAMVSHAVGHREPTENTKGTPMEHIMVYDTCSLRNLSMHR